MAGRLTLWGAGQLLHSYLGRTAEPPPAFYLALVQELAPSPYVSGAELDEPDPSLGYARALLNNDANTFVSDETTLHVVSNELEIPFITATGDWGRVAYWALCNAELEGYVFAAGEMENEQIIYAGDQVVIDPDELSIELGPFFTDEDF